MSRAQTAQEQSCHLGMSLETSHSQLMSCYSQIRFYISSCHDFRVTISHCHVPEKQASNYSTIRNTVPIWYCVTTYFREAEFPGFLSCIFRKKYTNPARGILTFASKSWRRLLSCNVSEFPTYYFKVQLLSQEPSADFSGTEREREKEKEHGEAIKGPPPGGA